MDKRYCELFCRCYPQFKMSSRRFESLLENENTHILSHSEGGELAGFAVIDPPAVRLIAVAPEYRHRGIGTVLLKRCEEYARHKGFDKLYTGGVSSKFLIGADKASAGFFEKNGFETVGGCDELLIELKDYSFDESAFHGHMCAGYGWYEGDMAALHKAVSEVDESWVQYFDGKGKVYAATVNGEIASFCLVSTDNSNYLTDAYGRVGMPGCVGTVPKFRSKGIALEMVARVTQYLKDCGMDISFIFFTGVASWYEKIGYKVFMSEVFMVKEIGGRKA